MPTRTNYRTDLDQKTSIGKKLMYVFFSIGLIGLVVWFFAPEPETQGLSIPPAISSENAGSSVSVGPSTSAIQPVPVPVAPEPIIETQKAMIPVGASMTTLLGDYFSAQEILVLDKNSKKVFPLTRIRAGRPYKIITHNSEFVSFVYEIDNDEQLVISRIAEQINIEIQPIVYETTTELIRGQITSSLFEAVLAMGEDSSLAIMIADIFQWDIDFILDIRSGDTFQVLVEKRSREGHPAGYGHILAAEFINRGQVFRAARFKDGEQNISYYDEDGHNIRKAFLKAPVSFSRISSGFTMRRFHPISKTWKAHPAIDYVAPVGTPIKTVGDGTISRIGRTKYNGNFIEVRHSNGYRTIYLHMKGFARGMKLHKRVSQGQVIGYLGGTGMATGPHLCFRMKKNGAPVNPTRLKAPATHSISERHLAEFKASVAPLFAQLNGTGTSSEHVALLDIDKNSSAFEETTRNQDVSPVKSQ